MNDEFLMELQPHGGALKRQSATEESPEDDGKWNADRRQERRQEQIPALYKTTHERLAYELALRMEPAEDIWARYRYTPESAAELLDSPAFAALLAKVDKEVQEHGLSFRMKAKAISEELLPTAFDMATDPLTPASVRADLIKWAAKVAGNEPPPAKEGAGGGGSAFSLSITFAGQQPVTIGGGVPQREPVTINQVEGP